MEKEMEKEMEREFYSKLETAISDKTSIFTIKKINCKIPPISDQILLSNRYDYERKISLAEYKISSALCNFNIGKYGLVVSGVELSSAIYANEVQQLKNLNLFLVHHNTRSACKAIEAFVAHMMNCATSDYDCIKYNSHEIIIYLSDFKFTISLVAYRNIGELLNSKELGSHAVCWDGTNMITNALGKFSYEYSVNIIDNRTIRTIESASDLQIALNYGFGIIDKSLDINYLMSNYRLLKYFNIVDIINETGSHIIIKSVDSLNLHYYYAANKKLKYIDGFQMNETVTKSFKLLSTAMQCDFTHTIYKIFILPIYKPIRTIENTAYLWESKYE